MTWAVLGQKPKHYSSPQITTTMGDSMCVTDNGSTVWSFGLLSPKLTIIAVTILGFLPLAIILLGPKLVYAVGGWVGFYLRSKTAGRKAQILDIVEREEHAWEEDIKERSRDSEEWDTLEGYGGSAGNGQTGEQEFDGIVGFFHPFW